MKYSVGIDIGTGSVKAVAVNGFGMPLAESQRYYPFQSPKPGYHEQDPELIWSSFCDSIEEIIKKNGDTPEVVGLSSAMHSLIPVDENCEPLAPMITWADSRSHEIAEKLRNSPEGKAIYEATGTPLHAMSPLCKLIWLKENEPALFERTYKFISIKEFIWYKLFGVFMVDYSIASCTGLFDISQLCWYLPALSVAGIKAHKLSEPVPPNYCREYNSPFGGAVINANGVSFVIGASDGCLANLGSMADKPGIAALTIGTSGAIRVASRRPAPDSEAMLFSYILDENTYICGGPVNNGGIAMQWWIKNFEDTKGQAAYDEIFKQVATVPPGNDGLLFLPYLTGERAPVWDAESCGIFFGARITHTKAHFARAVLEGICFALKQVADIVEQSSGEITQVNISGGFTKSDIWVQTLADIIGKKLVITQAEDASAIGAAWIAMKAANIIASYPEPDSASAPTFYPTAETQKQYKRHFARYKQLYPRLKDLMHTDKSGLL